MNLNEFQNKCKEKEDNLQERIDRYDEQVKFQNQFGHDYVPKWNLWTGTHKCSIDKSKLKVEHLYFKNGYSYNIYSCKICNYKYAKVMRE